jgi:endonuclease-3
MVSFWSRFPQEKYHKTTCIMTSRINWAKAVQPLLKEYGNTKHPLDYKNVYQLIVMVVLSARDTDSHINQLAPAFFKAFPHMQTLAKATPQRLFPYMPLRNFGKKAEWLIEIASTIKKDGNIPLTLEQLTALPGIGRKSANVILREAGAPAEGVIVDLHVVRVAQRLGIVTSADPKKIEQQLMEILPQKDWGIGMALSFLGREICRPKPNCPICPMKKVCAYYRENK